MPAPDPTNLDRVVDDYAPRQDAVEWAVAELTGTGRPFDEIEADLLAQGWDAETATGIVEEARQLTRSARGVTTRDDVLRASSRRYRQGMRLAWFTGMPALASLWRLILSIGTLLALRRRPTNRG